MARIKIDAFIEEQEFVDKETGKPVKFLRLGIPVTETATKYIKAEQFILQLAQERAMKNNK